MEEVQVKKYYIVILVLVLSLNVFGESQENIPDWVEYRPSKMADKAIKGWYEYFTNDWDSAESIWIKSQDEGHPLNYLGLADLAMSKNDYMGAFNQNLKAFKASADFNTPILARIALYRLDKLKNKVKDSSLYFKMANYLANDDSPEIRFLAERALLEELLRTGNWDEAKKVYSRGGFIANFYYLGPFPNKEGAGFDSFFPPEEDFSYEGFVQGKMRLVKWEPLPPVTRWGYIDLNNTIQPSDNSSVYLATWLESEYAKNIILALGHSGAVKIWINGKEVFENNEYHSAYPDQFFIKCGLNSGLNHLAIKICGKSEGMGLYIRLLEENYNPAQSISVNPNPGDGISLPKILEKPENPPATYSSYKNLLSQMPEEFRLRGQKALLQMVLSKYIEINSLADESDTIAFDTMDEAQNEFPESSVLLREKALIDKDDNRSRLALEKALSINPKDYQILWTIAAHYFFRGWYEIAEDKINLALEIYPNDGMLHHLSGRLHEIKGNTALANAEYRSALSVFPENPRTAVGIYRTDNMEALDRRVKIIKDVYLKNQNNGYLNDILFNYALESGDYNEVENLAVTALKINQFNYSPLWDIAENQIARGNIKGASDTLYPLLNMSPYHPRTLKLLGTVEENLGNREKAEEHFQNAFTTAPHDAWTEEYLRRNYPSESDYYEPFRIDVSDISDFDFPRDVNTYNLLNQKVQLVHADGNSSYTVHDIVKVLNPKGVREAQVMTVYYEPDHEKVKILRAKVITPDGLVFDAGPPTVRSLQSTSSAVSKLYGDYYALVVKMEGVSVGSVVDFEYEVTSTVQNIYGDYFGDIFYLSGYSPTLKTEYILLTPPEKNFYYKLHDPMGLIENKSEINPIISESDGRKIYHWKLENFPVIYREPYMPANSEVLPHLLVTTFKDWGEMAAWYWDLIKDQYKTDSHTRKLAQDLVGENYKNLSEMDRIKSVYHYVTTDIRYLGLEFGIHGYKPHKVDEICRAQYGDCKDKAALSVALLKELEVQGEMALLRTRHVGKISQDLAMLGVFNHAILYLPEVGANGMFLDGTAQYYGSGEIPSGDQGVRSLIIGPGGTYKWRDIPQSTAEENGGTYRTELILSSDGSAVGRRSIEFKGLTNPAVRNVYSIEGKINERIEKTFSSSYPGTTVDNISHSDFNSTEDDEWLEFDLKVPEFAANNDGKLSFVGNLFLNRLIEGYGRLSERKFDLVLSYPWHRNIETLVTLPAGADVEFLPDPVDVVGPFGSIKIEYKFSGNRIHYNEKLFFKAQRVTPDQYQEFRNFCNSVDRGEEKRAVITIGQ